MNNIKEIVKSYAKDFNAQINAYFPLPQGEEKRVVEAMFYSVSNGGKRLRPFLVAQTAKLFGIDFSISLPTAMSLEFLHSYSLIHDDLPAMDNDDLRRGFPTCHKNFDEATAILAGDGLLTYAFGILSNDKNLPTDTRIQLISLLAKASGAFDGMIAGQMLDLYAESIIANEDIIKRIEEMKTGCLIRYAVEAGAVLGNATEEQKKLLITYARKIGQAFQIADDILDVEGSTEEMGKTLHKDAAQGKVTFVSLYGIDKAKQIAKDLIVDAKKSLDSFGKNANILKDLADYIIERKS